jgi:hypothetical protein
VSSCQGASQSRSSCCFRTAILQHIVLHFEDNRPLFFCQQTQRRSIHPRCIPTLLCPPLWLREHENVEGRLASCLFNFAACRKVRISSAHRLSSGVSVSHSFCSSQCITHPSRRRGLLHLCSLPRSIFPLRIIYVGCNVIADLGRLDDTFLVDRRLRSKRCARAGCPLPMRPSPGSGRWLHLRFPAQCARHRFFVHE